MTDWLLCDKHESRAHYPKGAMCPKCAREFKQREAIALSKNWRELVPLDRTLDFIRTEAVYCRNEEEDFHSYRRRREQGARFDGSDANTLEDLRIKVLEKRAEFLQLYLTIINEEQKNVHQSKDCNR